MPASVRFAVAAVAVLVATNFGLLALILLGGMVSPLLILSLVLTSLVLWGLLRRHRLAWQWGRVLALFSALMNTAVLFLDFMVEDIVIASGWLFWVFVFQVVCLYSVFFALGKSTALEYFNLLCPLCQKATKRAANFWFTRARCKACDHVW